MRPRRSTPFAWARTNLFATPLDAAITLAMVSLLVLLLPPLARWAVLDAVWTGESKVVCREGGACWALVSARWRQILAGFYPWSELWRVALAAVALALAVAPAVLPRAGRLLWLTPAGVIAAFVLLAGTGAGPLPKVPTESWGASS